MIIVRVPFRVSLLGGGSDFEDFYREHTGYVLTTAIDKYVYIIVKERFDDKIVLNYTEREIVDYPIYIKHELIKEAMLNAGVQKGVEITTLADIPAQGTGLGSSSSVTVGLLHALYTYQGWLVTKEQLAEEACEIEITKLKKPIGRQDQYIATFGGLNLIKFTRYDVEVIPVVCDKEVRRKLSDSLLLFYTGVTRSADPILADQQSKIQENADIIKEMAGLALEGKKAIENGDIDRIGQLLHQNWGLKKLLSDKITNSEINKMYELAIGAGAIGGKIVGAGAGGFLLLCVKDGKRDEVRKVLNSYRELPFSLEKNGSSVIFDHRRGYD